VIDADRVPIHADAIELSRRDGIPPLEHALHDGEDYELLYTAPGDVAAGIRIGRITAGAEILLQSPNNPPCPLQAKGWQHELGKMSSR
jgi:thiamine-monophosphate kinase